MAEPRALGRSQQARGGLGEMDWQQEVRQKLDELTHAQQETALNVAKLMPREQTEALVSTRVSLDTFAGYQTQVDTRFKQIETGPANNRANLGLAIAAVAVVISLLCGSTEALIGLASLLHIGGL